MLQYNHSKGTAPLKEYYNNNKKGCFHNVKDYILLHIDCRNNKFSSDNADPLPFNSIYYNEYPEKEEEEKITVRKALSVHTCCVNRIKSAPLLRNFYGE